MVNYRKWSKAAARGRILAGGALMASALALVSCNDDKPTPAPTPVPTTPAPPPPPPVAFCDPSAPAPTPAPAPGSALTYQTGDGHRITIHNGVVSVQAPVTQTTEDFRYASHGTCDVLGHRVLRNWAGDRRSIILPGGAKLTMRGQGQQLLRVSIYDGAISREIDVLTHTVMHDSSDAAIARSRDAAEHDGETARIATHQGTAYGSTVTRTWQMLLVNLYNETVGSDGAVQPRSDNYRLLGRQDNEYVRAALPISPVAAETDVTCDTTPQPRGGLTQNANGTFSFLSRSGQWRIVIDRHTITVNFVGPHSMAVEHWGDPHENLNGKHIKDWEIARRSMILADGTKITMHADGPQHVVHTTSIYDGAQSHEIDNTANQLRHSCVNAAVAAQREMAEEDGETSLLAMLRSPQSTTGGLSWMNIYTETRNASRDLVFTLLGDTGEGDINANQVNDYYDDPRIGHT